jgi:hypothetical protein
MNDKLKRLCKEAVIIFQAGPRKTTTKIKKASFQTNDGIQNLPNMKMKCYTPKRDFGPEIV